VLTRVALVAAANATDARDPCNTARTRWNFARASGDIAGDFAGDFAGDSSSEDRTHMSSMSSGRLERGSHVLPLLA
jgi:hypothetical protein